MLTVVREDYTSVISKHIMWFFGPMKMRDIGSEQVREWVTALTLRGVRPRRIEYAKGSVLNAIFTTALHDGVIAAHPSRGVKTDPVPTKPRKIITAAQFDALYATLPDSDAQLLVETAIETGLRWGELTELRVRDIDVSGLLTVSRSVVRVAKRNHPEGRRFLVKQYPKDREWRQLRLSDQIARKLAEHVVVHGLGSDDLLFARRESSPRPDGLPDPPTLGLTKPNDAGRRYHHGTTTAYGLGRCRCEHCRHAVALYRAGRRRSGKDRPATGGAVAAGGPAPQPEHVPERCSPASFPGRGNRGRDFLQSPPRSRLMAARRRRGPARTSPSSGSDLVTRVSRRRPGISTRCPMPATSPSRLSARFAAEAQRATSTRRNGRLTN